MNLYQAECKLGGIDNVALRKKNYSQPGTRTPVATETLV